MSSPESPSCSLISRASITARNSTSTNTSNCDSGGGGISLIRQGVPKRRGVLFPQYGYLVFKLSVSSPNLPSCSDSAHASITTSVSARTSHCESSGGVKRRFVPFHWISYFWALKEVRELSEHSLWKCHFTSCVCGGGNSVSYLSYSDSERYVVHTAFSVTTDTHDSGSIKFGDQPQVSFPVWARKINQYTLIK